MATLTSTLDYVWISLGFFKFILVLGKGGLCVNMCFEEETKLDEMCRFVETS